MAGRNWEPVASVLTSISPPIFAPAASNACALIAMPLPSWLLL